MLSVLFVILPVFALIFAGWTARHIGVLGPHATTELNRFVVYLALPAMLIHIVATAKWNDIWQPGFIGAFGLGSVLLFGATVAFRMRGPRHLTDAAIDGLNAAYPNTGYMGFPLALAALGPAALAPTLIATILTVCAVFALALVLIEVGLQAERHPLRMAANLSLSLARNPLLAAPMIGAVFLASGIEMPGPADRFLVLLGNAASPCALIALGLFLGDKRESAASKTGDKALLVTLKLIGQPVLTWLLATRLFHLSAPLTHAAVLIAALPTGTGPFMVAEFYRREADLTAGVVLISTILSLATITVYLSMIA